MNKVREIFPDLHNAIRKLTNMSADCAKLEYSDNNSSSLEFRKALIEFENVELKKLKSISLSIREVIKTKPKRNYDSTNNYLKRKYNKVD